ncbi:hypothetical protein BC833DRAFT_563292 [Globomyces pollinis-pini]|nr:hypothetical protein BC833DRAFT_563292 [Globomyces pollinis-pini]
MSMLILRNVTKKVSLKQKVNELESKVTQLKNFVKGSKTLTEIESNESIKSTDDENFGQSVSDSVDDDNTVQLYTENSTSIFTILHSKLMKCWTLFSDAKPEDVYKLFYDTIVQGRKFGYFQNASFIFPNEEILSEIISNSTPVLSEQEQKQAGILWNLCLKIDNFQKVVFSQNFIILEPGIYSHYNLPVSMNSVSDNDLTNGILSDLTSVVVESEDKNQLTLLETQRKFIRLHRWMLHLESLLTPDILYTTAELRMILLNLHYSTLDVITTHLFDSFDQFASKQFVSKNSKDLPTFDSRLSFVDKASLLLLASLHSTAIEMKVDLKLPLTNNKEMKSDVYTSTEIILICLRAYTYLISTESVTEIDRHDRNPLMELKILEQSLSLMFCVETCRVCIKSNIADMTQQVEIESMVKNVMFPYISSKGWNWPLAAYFGYKMQGYFS